MTYSIAHLEVSQQTYDEIAVKLREAGYNTAFGATPKHVVIDMHGIGLTRADEPIRPPATPMPMAHANRGD